MNFLLVRLYGKVLLYIAGVKFSRRYVNVKRNGKIFILFLLIVLLGFCLRDIKILKDMSEIIFCGFIYNMEGLEVI